MIKPIHVQNALLGLITSSGIVSLVLLLTSCSIPKEYQPFLNESPNEQCVAGFVQDAPNTGTVAILRNLSTNPEVIYITEADYTNALILIKRIGPC